MINNSTFHFPLSTLIKTLTVACFLVLMVLPAEAFKSSVLPLDSARNASMHNNKGIAYAQEGYWTSAIEEFRIAISLNPDSQASAVYYNNLGEAYAKFGQAQNARICFEQALLLYPFNLKYYQNLAACYKTLGLAKQKISEYEQRRGNYLNTILLGLLYIETGDVRRGTIKLDEFIMSEPKLLISKSLREYLSSLNSP